MAKHFENPAYLRAKLHDLETGENTAQNVDQWAYVALDGGLYTHPTKEGAKLVAARQEVEIFTLRATYEDGVSEATSADKFALLAFGKDHHNASQTKPEMMLLDGSRKVIATMDVWAMDWTEV